MNPNPTTRRGFFQTAGLAAGAAALAACAPGTAEDTSMTRSGPRGEWENTWDQWVEGAKKEGKLILAMNPAIGADKMVELFEEAFPGIKTEYQGFTSASLFVPKIQQERGVGLHNWDAAAFTFQTFALVLRPDGAVQPIRPYLIHPDAIDDKSWYGGFEDGFRDGEKKWAYIFNEIIQPNIWMNTDLVGPNELRTIDDILNPKWKGKMQLADVRTGTGYTYLTALRRNKGEDFVKRLIVDQQPVFSRNDRQFTEDMVRGKFAIGSVDRANLAELTGQGITHKLKWLDFDEWRVATASPALWLFDRAPHPNAARVFVNWALTKKVQEIWNQAVGSNSRRLDVPPASPDYSVQGGKKYMKLIHEDALKEQEDTRKFLEDLVK